MNLPNKLTVARIIMVPFFVVFLVNVTIPHHFLIAGLIFALASFTDLLDGKIAVSYTHLDVYKRQVFISAVVHPLSS